jgi:hypothetical protein
LISNKTAKEIFGKVWIKTPLFWKNLAKKFGGEARPSRLPEARAGPVAALAYGIGRTG